MSEEIDTFYSSNDQEYRHSEIADAIEEFLNDGYGPGDVIEVYEGELSKAKTTDFVPNIVEYLSENAYDNHSEYCDGWPFCTEEQDEELQLAVNKLVEEWADKHNLHPNFGFIENVTRHKLRIVNEEGDTEPA